MLGAYIQPLAYFRHRKLYQELRLSANNTGTVGILDLLVVL
jgi:hypothetical protein